MARLEFNRVLLIAIGALTVCVIGAIATAVVQGARIRRLNLAAGSSSGESYILSNALKQVVERRYPSIRIALLETGGTVENMKMLDDGRAQLAAAQADVTPGPAARILAILYDDTFQVLVFNNSRFRSFADLRGARIGLAPSGGQFRSFLRVAEHFGLHEGDFHFIGSSDQAADQAFLNGEADAVFRVRALGNPSIQRLVQSGKVHFLPIEQAAAMNITQPDFEPALIPAGAYLGNPPAPAQDLPTVAVHRTLLARDDADADAIRAITGVLMDRRHEIIGEIPEQVRDVGLLLAQARRPGPQTGLGSSLHPGAISFYDKDKPSFLLAHADYVGLMLTVVLMAASWIFELKRWMQSQQKNVADRYSDRAIELMKSAQEANSLQSLEELWRDLLAILGEAVHDLDADKLSEKSFDSFRSILQIALEATRDRRAFLGSYR